MAEETLDPERIKTLKSEIASALKWVRIGWIILTPISILFAGWVCVVSFVRGKWVDGLISMALMATVCAIGGILVLVFWPKTKRYYTEIKDPLLLHSRLLLLRVSVFIVFALSFVFSFVFFISLIILISVSLSASLWKL